MALYGTDLKLLVRHLINALPHHSILILLQLLDVCHLLQSEQVKGNVWIVMQQTWAMMCTNIEEQRILRHRLGSLDSHIVCMEQVQAVICSIDSRKL